jgi:hypothetical protein
VPLDAVDIREFEIVLEAASGRFAWRGALSARRGPDGATRARLTNARDETELTLLPGGTEAGIRLRQHPATEVLAAELSGLDRERIRISARFDLVGTLDWLSDSVTTAEDRRSAPLLERARDAAVPVRGATVEVKAVATPAAELLEADAVASLAGRRLLSVAARPAKNGALDIDARGEFRIAEALALARPLLPAAFAETSLDEGTLNFSGRLKRAAGRWNGNGRLALTPTTGAFQSLEIRGLELAAQLDALRPLRGSLAAKAGSIRLAADVELANLVLKADGRDGLLHLTEAAADALGGRLSLEPEVVDLSRLPHGANLSARGLDLATILALFGRPELSGSGRLDANLPLRFAAGQFEVHEGTLTGTSPGTLRYRTDQPDNIALKALNDLHYRSLDAALNYDRDGEYRVRARIVGHNPELLAGHPVALNLNLSGRLPRLLASALLSGDFSGHVLKEVSGDRAGTADRP